MEKFNDPTPLWRRLLRSRGHRRNALGLRTQPAGQGRQHRASTAACSLLVLVGGGPCSSSPAWRNLTAPRPSGTSPFDLRATFGSPETPSSSLLFSSGLASPPQPPAVCCCLLAAAPAGFGRPRAPAGPAPPISGSVPPLHQPHVAPCRLGVAMVLAVARGCWQWPWQWQPAPPRPRPTAHRHAHAHRAQGAKPPPAARPRSTRPNSIFLAILI